jgi:uncharacterized coiled-coil protein SlyX
MCRTLTIVMALSLCACASPAPEATPPSPPPAVEPQIQIVRDPGLERHVTQLEVQLIERDALIESLNTRLEKALQEVVATMAKLRSLATRAEAASAMAEADVALQSIAKSAGASPELKRASRLMDQSSAEFKRKNFGGALYLANQAKVVMRVRATGGAVGKLRHGEIAFAEPVKLRARSDANVRVGPGMNFAVSYSVVSGSALSGLSYLGEWIRVTNEAGKEGWTYGSLVSGRDAKRP